MPRNILSPIEVLKSIFIAMIVIVAICLPSRSWCLDGADVAIYNDTALTDGGAWQEGLEGIKAMLNSYGYSHEDITPNDVNTNGNLQSLYKVIVFGGGWAAGYNTYINAQGIINIRNFVEWGGGYFGICAGAYFASDFIYWKPDVESKGETYDYRLSLFKGVGIGPVLGIKTWTSPTGCSSGIISGAAMTTVTVNTMIIPSVGTDLHILYFGGPAFTQFLDVSKKAIVVATYKVPGFPADGKPAMILFSKGKGKVFLSGPHPEISFDNCSFYYSSSTWHLMNSVMSILMHK